MNYITVRDLEVLGIKAPTEKEINGALAALMCERTPLASPDQLQTIAKRASEIIMAKRNEAKRTCKSALTFLIIGGWQPVPRYIGRANQPKEGPAATEWEWTTIESARTFTDRAEAERVAKEVGGRCVPK